MNDEYFYIKSFVETNLETYSDYVCNKVIDRDDYNSNQYDIFCSFGNDLKFINYRVSNIEKYCSIDTTSNYYNSNHLERIICTTSDSYMINNYDYIYTNLTQDYPSITSSFELTKSNNLTYDINYMYMIPFCILLILLWLFWSRKK